MLISFSALIEHSVSHGMCFAELFAHDYRNVTKAYFSALLSQIFPVSQFICIIHLATLHFLIVAVNCNSPACFIASASVIAEIHLRITQNRRTPTQARKTYDNLTVSYCGEVFYLQSTQRGILCLM